MLVCASCGHENSEGAKFCEECGIAEALRLYEQKGNTVSAGKAHELLAGLAI